MGTLAPGAHADLVAVDLDDLSMQPGHDLLRTIVYAMEPTAVRHLYVGGEPVVRDGRLVRMEEREIVQRLRALTMFSPRRHGGTEARGICRVPNTAPPCLRVSVVKRRLFWWHGNQHTARPRALR